MSTAWYRCEDCGGCPRLAQCCRAKGQDRPKELVLRKTFWEKRKQAEKNILTQRGILLRLCRSIQVEGAFGQRRIGKVKTYDAKAWLIKLQEDGRGYSTIHSIRSVVRPAFQLAAEHDLLLKNPFEFQLNTVVVNDSVTREAISRQQEWASEFQNLRAGAAP